MIYNIFYYDHPIHVKTVHKCYNTDVIKYIDVTIQDAMEEYPHIFIN